MNRENPADYIGEIFFDQIVSLLEYMIYAYLYISSF